jgi:cytochrome c5
VSESDRTFATAFKGVLIFLVVLTVVIFILARFLGKEFDTTRQGADYQQKVQEAIAPVGEVNLGEPGSVVSAAPGETAMKTGAEGGATPGPAAEAPQAKQAAAGEQPSGATAEQAPGAGVYRTVCFACHDTGAAGAPKVGDNSAWQPRIAKGVEVLVQHAVQGFQGSQGMMPAKGGNPALSDQQVADAVHYMIDESQ